MALNTFPTLTTMPSSISVSNLSTVKKAVSENKYPMIRRIGTKVMQEWSVSYGDGFYLTAAEIATLQTFFDTNMGLFFNWLNEDTNNTHIVFFNMDALVFRSPFVNSGVYYTDLILTGV